MSHICTLCPRNCNALRDISSPSGYCKSPSHPVVCRAAPHFGEEPCISGTRGSGAIFFSGCSLRCVFCQNHAISRSSVGKELTVAELRDTMLRLRDTGVHNINLVTASHFTDSIAEALSGIELGIPVVWNSSGYESVDSLRMLDGLVQIYLPDYKYAKIEPAKKYSFAADYPQVALNAIKEMYRQRGPLRYDADGLLQSGLVIRHLVLPDNELNTMDVIDNVAELFPEESVIFSLMGQYTPMPDSGRFPELEKRIDAEIYDMLCSYMVKKGIYPGYIQELESSGEEMIPAFDLTGI